MDVREKMRSLRNTNQIDLEVLSKASNVSVQLISMVEDGEVTHPDLAKAIGRVYGLTELETEELMPIHRRKHDPRYDPDKYKEPEIEFSRKILHKQEYTVFTRHAYNQKYYRAY